MTNELTGGSFILVIEHKYAGVGEELAAFMRDDGCVFWYVSTREWVFAGRRKSLSETCLPPLYQASEKEMGGSGCGGLSVLEESHVVGESGQLLLIWNQWDGGRICWERERESEGRKKQRRSWVRRGFLVLPSAIDLLTSPRLQLGGHSPRASAQRDSAGRWFQVTSPPPPICLTTLPTESPPWNMWDIQPGDRYTTLYIWTQAEWFPVWDQLYDQNYQAMLRCGKGGGAEKADTWGWLVSGVSVLCRTCVQQMLQQHRPMITERRTGRGLLLLNINL